MRIEAAVIVVQEFDLFLMLTAGLLGGLLAWTSSSDEQYGLLENFATGVAGAVLGYYTLGYFGFGYGGGMLEVMLCAATGAIVFLLIAGLIRQW